MTKTNQPLVSIVIPVYNGSNFLKEAIDSALNQTYPNTEIIVVNDGSTDNGKTEAIAKSYGNKIRYYHKENGGVSSALNYGISKMKGEYFSWLSHDDIYLPEKVEEEIKAVSSDNTPTIVFSNFHLIDSTSKIIATTKSELRATKHAINSNIFPVLRGMVNGDTILIHRDIFKSCGTFDESVSTSADYILWLKIFKKFPHHFIDKPLIGYRIHPGQDTQKHPEYNHESDVFWTNAISGITESDAKSWGYSLLQIYTDLYRQFQNDSLVKASKKAYELCLSRKELDTPIVTVAIPAFNAGTYLERTLESLLQSDFGNFEAIIVDDASTDHTLDIAKEYAKHDFRIHVIHNDQNLGVAKALNLALEKASGKYFTRLDSDDTIAPSKILREYLVLEESEHAFVTTNINLIDEHDHITTACSYAAPIAPLSFEVILTNPIPNSPLMYRLNTIRLHHLLFENLTAAEDYGFLLKVLHFGTGIMINEPLYNYRIRTESLYHSDTEYAMIQSAKLCEEYVSSFYDEYEKTNLFRLLNHFDQPAPNTIKYDRKLFLTIIEESETLIHNFSKKFHYTDMEINACRLYILDNLIARLSPPNHEFEYSMKTPVRMTYYYFRANGVKKTIRKIIKKLTHHD